MSGDLVQLEGRKGASAGVPDNTARLVLTLTVAGLLSGIAIVSAYEITRPMIAANQARALERAVFEVVPGAERLQRLAWRDGALVPAVGDAAGEPSIYGGYAADGSFAGYAIPGEGAGYQDTIKLLYGFDAERRRVVGMYILESRETPGLGDRIYKDLDFVAAFRDLVVEPEIELVSGGGAADNQVDGITGATISSKAVVSIINATNSLWRERLFAPGAEPPPPAEPATEEKP
ncbi:MAG: FMN-binding protein [bacterium]|nr:FMN-binding protein [bacterium]